MVNRCSHKAPTQILLQIDGQAERRAAGDGLNAMVLLFADQVEHVVSCVAGDLVTVDLEHDVAGVDEVEQLTVVGASSDVELEQLDLHALVDHLTPVLQLLRLSVDLQSLQIVADLQVCIVGWVEAGGRLLGRVVVYIAQLVQLIQLAHLIKVHLVHLIKLVHLI